VSVGFVSEKQVAEGKADKFKVIFIPETECLYPKTVKKLSDYVDANGKIAIVASDKSKVFVADEHKLPFNETINRYRENILNKANLYNLGSDDELQKNIFALLRNMGLTVLILKDVQSGKLAKGIEWRTAKCEGKLIVNIANYTMKPKKIAIIYKGHEIAKMINLITRERITGNKLKISGLTPALLECE